MREPVVRMINPSPSEIEELMRFRLVGFNCRRYDVHILYARLIGLYKRTALTFRRKSLTEVQTALIKYNVSYTDVYDCFGW